jgi:hypothetical protein
MPIYKDFLGLNICIYDPTHQDFGSYGSGSNVIGYNPEQIVAPWPKSAPYWYTNDIGFGNVGPLTKPTEANVMVLLNLHRNGHWGYGSWKQIRVSNNHLTRYQKRNSIFTFVREPGDTHTIKSPSGRTLTKTDKYGKIEEYTESYIADSYKPLQLVGSMRVYNPITNTQVLKSVEIKASFGNETVFFANDEINRYFDSIKLSDDNYEELKSLYLNDGLNDDSSPIETFNLLVYKQTVWPKMKDSYLNKTRSRVYFKNEFWRSNRPVRTEDQYPPNGFGSTVPSQSIWPLDVASDWSTRKEPQQIRTGSPKSWGYYIGGIYSPMATGMSPGGFNTGDDTASSLINPINTPASSSGGAGILMNSYSQLGRSSFVSSSTTGSKFNRADFSFFGSLAGKRQAQSFLTASCYYSRRHTLCSHASITSPTGMNIEEITRGNEIATASFFEGLAHWDAPIQKGIEPFYDSYEKFSADTRLKGQSYSIIPEFRISSHVPFYDKNGPLIELPSLLELSGARSTNTTTANQPDFYKIINTSDLMKHFELIVNDHKDFTKPSIITMKCKAVKKLLPYAGFYPADRTVQVAQQFYSSYSSHTSKTIRQMADPALVSPVTDWRIIEETGSNYGFQGLLEPLFAPGVLFNTIKAGVACDYPVLYANLSCSQNSFNNHSNQYDTPKLQNHLNIMLTESDLTGSNSDYYFDTQFSKRVPFEALVEPARHLARRQVRTQEMHPGGGGNSFVPTAVWDGEGDTLYKKMVSNFLAEVPEFFLEDENFTTISSLESSSPAFGNAVSGTFYTMRVKMSRTKDKPNETMGTITGEVTPPQDLYADSGVKETMTMYSRTTAFGPPIWGGGSGSYHHNRIIGGSFRGAKYHQSGSDSTWGYNFCYTPPYYHGDAWCDLIFEAKQTKKYTLDEILSEAMQYPYYSRFYWYGEDDAFRDLSGHYQINNSTVYEGPYKQYGAGSPWRNLMQPNFKTFAWAATNPENRQWQKGATGEIPPLRHFGCVGPQHPSVLNFNAMQLNSTVNLFGTAIKQGSQEAGTEVFSEATNKAKSRWVIQPKFETPILNFNKYTSLDKNNCTKPLFASESVPRGMWHQYGELPKEEEGIHLEVSDVPDSWLRGALRVNTSTIGKRVKSLADLVGFEKTPRRLGNIAGLKEISEAVVAIPFIEKNATRQFFTIPKEDILDTVSALRREVEPGVFIAGGPPKVGNSVVHMVKMMEKYVFPPSFDFIRYDQIQPFAMYVFEFKHNLDKEDLQRIWQNLPPKIGRSIDTAEATISHELLASELLGGGAVIKNGKLDENAEGPGVPSDLKWMIFKAKKRAKDNYFDKVIQNTGRFPKPALLSAMQNQQRKEKEADGIDTNISYNWPYDFFSLVELVKLDAEITFSNIENDDKGQKMIKPIVKSSKEEEDKKKRFSRDISFAKGKHKK